MLFSASSRGRPNAAAIAASYGRLRALVEPPSSEIQNRTPAAWSLAASAMPSSYGSDRKSTRLNSSHLGISYAVFCLKKKKDSERVIDAIARRHDITVA